MSDLAKFNSNDFGWKVASMFAAEFQARFDRLNALIDRVEAAPTSEEILEVLGCERDDLVAYLAILEAHSRESGEVSGASDFPGFPLDVSATLHPIEGSTYAAYTFTKRRRHSGRQARC